MYGTIARMKLQPGKAAELKQLMEGLDAPEGNRGVVVYQSDADPDTVWVAGFFENREAYQKSAASPEQSARFAKIRALAAADPEWHDGEILYSRFD